MKQTILTSLFALCLPLACRAKIGPESPFTITFVKENQQGEQWIDMTKYDDSSLLYTGTGTELGGLKFHDFDKPAREFKWQPGQGDGEWVNCTAVINGDPHVSEVIYHLDKKSFEFKDPAKPPVLSVVHVRCEKTQAEKQGDEIARTPVNIRIDPEEYWKQQAHADPLASWDPPTPPVLGPTDFENMVDIRYYITDMSNTDAQWADTTIAEDSSWSDWEKTYQKLSPDRIDLNGTTVAPSATLVGRHVFFEYQTSPKTFSWKLHEGNREKKCFSNVVYDPHVSIVRVNLDNDDISIDGQDKGDLEAINVYC